MFDFDKYVVSELKALCAELGIVVANSARKPEYVEALKKFFEADNVADTLMGLGHENLKKVCRRLSLQAGSKTKRELTDAILAKVNPQPGPVVTAPVVITDPEPENRKGLPWWAWVLILIAAALLLWGIFRPRPTPAPVDLSPIRASITDLTGRVDALEQAELEAPTFEPVVYNTFGDLGKFYRNVDEEVVGFHKQGEEMQYTCQLGEIGVYLSIDKTNTVMGEANESEVVAYIPCPSDGSAITATTVHWSGEFQRAHWVVVEKELPMTPLEALMLLKAEEQNRKALFFNAESTLENSY